jgi:hypothetical protein
LGKKGLKTIAGLESTIIAGYEYGNGKWVGSHGYPQLAALA